jgi:nicotinate dehydrogenase subunit A
MPQDRIGDILARSYTNGILVAPTTLFFATWCPRMTPDTIRLTVNGKIHDIAVAPATPLLYVLRNDLELNGAKFGCGLGECGACTVVIDGVAARSCVVPVGSCTQRQITTLEGLGTRDRLDPLQVAFIENQAAQCGYCLNGMIMTAKALLLRNAHPSEREIREALRYNLCRCGTHVEIINAVLAAAGHQSSSESERDAAI